MTPNNWFQIVLRKVNAELRALGFRRKGQLFAQEGEDTTLFVHFVRSDRCPPGTLSFTADVGVFSKPVAQRMGWSFSPYRPITPWLVRIGWLMPEENDVWWTALSETEAAAASEEIADSLRNHGVPALRRLDSTEKLVALWRQDGSIGASPQTAQMYLSILAGTWQGPAALALNAPVPLPGQTEQASVDAEGHVARGLMREREGDRDGAVREMEEAVRADPNHATAHYHLGRLFGAVRPASAAAALRRSLALDQTRKEARVELARVLRSAGHAAEAAQEYRELLRDDPSNVELLYDLCDCLWLNGNTREAAEIEQLIERLKSSSHDPRQP